MEHCIIFALYLPSIDKVHVIEEIFSYIRDKKKDAKIFIGIQGNSIPETEEILRNSDFNTVLDYEFSRVPSHLTIDSDASAFIEALRLYSKSSMDFYRCYFIHTKGITSGNDPLRKAMFDEIFDDATIYDRFVDDKVGSYGPYITFIDVPGDIAKMSCFAKFNEKAFTHPAMEYYYINTMYVIKGHLLRWFIKDVSPDFFNTHVDQISDRWMFERDFMHVADMMGYRPSFKHFHGNYSTNYKAPNMAKYEEKLNKWLKGK